MREARATSKMHGPCLSELGFLPKGAVSIAGLASQSEYWSVLSNQALRQAAGRRVFFGSRVCVGSPWPTGVRVGPAFIAGTRSSEENVGELGSCAMVSEGPLSPGGEGRRLSRRSRGDRRSSGLGRDRQPAKQPRPWADGLWAAPPLGRFCAEQGIAKGSALRWGRWGW